MENSSEISAHVVEAFNLHPTVDRFYQTEDGVLFHDISLARLHDAKGKITSIGREEIPKAETDQIPKAPKNRALKTPNQK